jgi:hypothetical protein
MKRFIAFGASLLVNALLLGAVSLNAYLADKTPAGEVSVTQVAVADTAPSQAGASS